MLDNVAGGKALINNPNTTKALMASLLSAALLLGISILGAGLLLFIRPLRILRNSRTLLNPQPVKRSSKLVDMLSLNLCDSDFIAEQGIEAMCFLKYLRFMLYLCVALSITIFPALVCYTALNGSSTKGTDWLVVISWASLTSRGTKIYWLYTIFVPVFVAIVSYSVTKQLEPSVSNFPADEAPNTQHYVHISPRGNSIEHTQQLESQLSRWHQNMSSVSIIESPGHSLHKLAALVQKIEKSETLFIAKMLHRASSMGRDEFYRHLSQEITARYTTQNEHRKSANLTTNTAFSLYQQLMNVRRSPTRSTVNQAIAQRISHPRSFLLSINDFYAAQALVHSTQVHGSIETAKYLGTSLWDICVTHLNKSATWADISKGIIRFTLVMLAAGLTVPMALAGSLSQITTLLRMTGPLKALKIPERWVIVIQGVIPPLLTSIIMSLFPILTRKILQYGQYCTRTKLEADVGRYYLLFLIVQLLIVPTIASALVPTIWSLTRQNLMGLPILLATNLPLAGNYYMSYLLIQAISLISTAMFRVIPLVRLVFLSKKTYAPRQRLEYLRSLQYNLQWGDLYAFYSALACIVLTFSLLTPLILPIAAAVFGSAFYTFRFILLHLSGKAERTDGRLQRWALLNIFIGLYIAQITFIGLFVLKFDNEHCTESMVQLLAVALTFVIFVQYHLYLKRKFDGRGMAEDFPQLAKASAEADAALPHRIISDDDLHLRGLPEQKICIPRDDFGISQTIIKETSEIFAQGLHGPWITDEYATMSASGEVLLRAERSSRTVSDEP